MTVNQTEYRTSIGLDSIYVAKITQDDALGYVTDAPIYLAPVAELSGAPKINEETVYYDDAPFETLSSEGITERKLKVSALPPEIEALLTGEVFDAVNGRYYDSAAPAEAPYFALGYRAMKSNGHYRYYWFLKGKFQKPGGDHTTLGEKAEGKPIELMYSAIKTVYKFDQTSRTEGVKRIMGDEDTTNFSATGWFTAVQTPATASPSALSCTYSPTDGATNQLATVNIVLTFNNKIRSGNAGIVVTKADGSIVAAAYSWDAAVKVLTIDPTSSLTAGATYLTTVSGVTDIYGQVLADAVKDFAVAA